MKAICFMDTVSQIRGNMGRPALDESRKIYMMKKDVDHQDNAGKGGRKFEFLLEATEGGEKLIDGYVGVEFSIVYKVTATGTAKSTGKKTSAELLFYATCPGRGIDPAKGRKLVP